MDVIRQLEQEEIKRLGKELPAFAPGDTVVVMITGNGLKTLDDHPPKPWPAKIDCEVDAMLSALTELKGSGTLADSARKRLHGG